MNYPRGGGVTTGIDNEILIMDLDYHELSQRGGGGRTGMDDWHG